MTTPKLERTGRYINAHAVYGYDAYTIQWDDRWSRWGIFRAGSTGLKLVRHEWDLAAVREWLEKQRVLRAKESCYSR